MGRPNDCNSYVLVHLGRKNAGPRILKETARALSDSGLLVGLICSSYVDNITELESFHAHPLKIKTYLGRKSFIWSLFILPFRVYQIIRYVRQFEQVRVMFVMHHLWDPIILRLLRVSTNHKIIYWLHDAKNHPGENGIVNRILVSSGIKYADTVITLSEYVTAEIEVRANCPPIIQISHPIVRDLGTLTNVKKDNQQVLFLGRLSKYKGLARLCDAWKIISAEFPNANLVIAGDGDIELANKLTRNLLNCRKILKYLSDSEIATLLSNSAVVVLPYDEASQSGILVKAFEYGIPYVATPVGALPEQHSILKGGLITEDMEATSFAKAVKLVLVKGAEEFRFSVDDLSYRNQISHLHKMLDLQSFK